jgi:hypothetical protein
MPESLTRRANAADVSGRCPASFRNHVRLRVGTVSGFARNRVRHRLGISVRLQSDFADWQAAKVGDLIDIKLKTLSDTQTAKVNALIDTKLKTLNDSQPAKLIELIPKILNDTQTAPLNEMIDTKLNTLSNSQTERLNELIDIKLNNLSGTQTEKINEQKTIDAILSTINTKIDNIERRLQSREQRGYVVGQEDECGCQGDLRWSHSGDRDHR